MSHGTNFDVILRWMKNIGFTRTCHWSTSYEYIHVDDDNSSSVLINHLWIVWGGLFWVPQFANELHPLSGWTRCGILDYFEIHHLSKKSDLIWVTAFGPKDDPTLPWMVLWLNNCRVAMSFVNAQDQRRERHKIYEWKL